MNRSSRRIRALFIGAAAVLAVGAGIVLPGTSDAATTLKSLADAKGKDVGFALDPNRLSESAYKNVADTEFNFVVPENAMKWDATESSRGSFSFGSGDQVANYAASTGKGLYGHTLVWHSQLPGWVSNISSGTDLLQAMKDHIAGVAGHFRSKIDSWDVVNEAFDGGNRRSSVFQQRIGNGYIEEAFRAARAADPAAKLCINDFSTDGVNAKSTAIFNLVSDFKARGVPIDCVGFQSHLIVGQVPGDYQANLQRFANLGVDVRITELDIRMPTPASSANLAAQASDYKKVFNACLAVSRCQGVTIWGITDKYSWVPSTFPGQGAALVWDDNYNRKPAYDAITEALGGTIGPTTSPTASPTTGPTTGPAGACRVTYTVSAWNTGLTTAITIANTSSSAVNGWALTFTLPSGQTITSGWNASYSPTSGAVTARNASYNGTIGANGSVGIGFQATHTGNSGKPTSFSLNGTACSVA
jgi:endo-1,4-beta-xylanase